MSVSLFLKFMQLRWKARMQYRADFMLQIFGLVVGHGSQYVVIWLLLQRFQTIAGWTWPEMAFVYSLNLFSYAIGASFALGQQYGLEEDLVSGDFDKYLTKPLHPFFYFNASNYSVGYIAHFFLAGSILLWSALQLSIDWTVVKIIALCFFVITSSLLQAAFFVFIGSIAFRTLRIQFLFNLYFNLRDFIAYPITVFNIFIQILLTFVVPLAFINFYPSILILSKENQFLPSWTGWFAIVVGPLVIWIAVRLWMSGVDKYQSAGG